MPTSRETLSDTLRCIKSCIHRSAFTKPIWKIVYTFVGVYASCYAQILRIFHCGDYLVQGQSVLPQTIYFTLKILLFDRLVSDRDSFGLLSHYVWPSLNCLTHRHTFLKSLTPSLRLQPSAVEFLLTDVPRTWKFSSSVSKRIRHENPSWTFYESEVAALFFTEHYGMAASLKPTLKLLSPSLSERKKETIDIKSTL